MRLARSILAVLANVVLAACNSSPSGVGSVCATAGGTCVLGSSPCATRAPEAYQDCETNPPSPGGAFCCMVVDAGVACVPDGGIYTCLGSSWPVCPASAQGEQACSSTAPSCMGCSEGAGYTCSCEDAGLVPDQKSPLWGCIGTEETCQ